MSETHRRHIFGLRTLRGLWRGFKARPRLTISVIFGVACYLAAPMVQPMTGSVQALVAWNAGAVLYLLLGWEMMSDADAVRVREHALGQDEGRIAILLLVVLSALAVLVAVGTQVLTLRELHGLDRVVHLGLAALTIVTSWLFTQMLFALHYAHDFYSARMRGAADPLLFPGTPDPVYSDFFHFSCVIGTSAQTADVSFNGSLLRPVGTLHCILAFVFNATLLALCMNLAAGQLG